MNEHDYLQAANVIKLQSAARMAGLRWKSGAPGYDKAGIIDKLMQHPSIMRATIATLQRMESGDMNRDAKSPSSFLDDISDETETPAPQAPQQEAQTPDLQNLRNSIDAALRVIRDISQSNKREHSEFRVKHTAIQGDIAHICADIEALKKARPIELHFPNLKPIEIDPSSCHVSYPKLLKYLQINRRVVLVGSAGTGKSMAVKNSAEALNVPFYLVPPVTMSHELIGHRDAQGNFHGTPLFEAYTKGGLCLLDEADASLPDALLCANPILDGNGFATFGDGVLHKQHPDFMAVFNMNTDGNGATMQYSGRNRLDGATLARFGVRIFWEIDNRIESAMAQGQTLYHEAVKAVRTFMTQRDIVDVNATPRHVKTGAALLNAGLPKHEVFEDVLKSGALGAVWQDVTNLPAVRSFLRS